MWVISGGFDNDEQDDYASHKERLLKPGKKYTMGRYDGAQIMINSKKCSHSRRPWIEVKKFDCTSDPSVKPSVIFHNDGPKATVVKWQKPGSDVFMKIEPDASQEISDGEWISIGGFGIKFDWKALACLVQPVKGKASPESSFGEQCNSLGIHLLSNPHELMTHHLTQSLKADSLTAVALVLNCTFATSDWLKETIRLGNLPMNNNPADGISLEQNFTLPDVSRYFPSTSSLPDFQKDPDNWTPNSRREKLFKKYRFLCVGEKPREIDTDTRTMIEFGEGVVEKFNVHDGKEKFRTALRRCQAKSAQTVVMADKSAMVAAVDVENWGKYEKLVKEYQFPLVSKDRVIQAVFDADASIILNGGGENEEVVDAKRHVSPSSTPDYIPNTIPEEPSIPPATLDPPAPPRRKLMRRAGAASRQASEEPSHAPPSSQPPVREETEGRNNEDLPKPRRKLTRRVGVQPMITGLDDPPSVIAAAADQSTTVTSGDSSGPSASQPSAAAAAPTAAPRSILDPTNAIPARPSRLKRRVGTAAETQSGPLSSTFNIFDAQSNEPPTKRFKALFEATDPDKMDEDGSGENTFNELYDSTQGVYDGGESHDNAGEGRGRGAGRRRLDAVTEEDVEEGSIQSRTHAKKRKVGDREEDDEEDAVMVDITKKRRAIENVNAVSRENSVAPQPTKLGTTTVHKTSDDAGRGADPGQPDTDAAFLKALASTKKGKKKEDTFDREFNNLRIAKPPGKTLADERDEDMEEEEDMEEQYKILSQFNDEEEGAMMTGNFMVVCEFDAEEEFRAWKEKTREERQREGEIVESGKWAGRENFKKFKQKNVRGPRREIELVVSDANTYGLVDDLEDVANLSPAEAEGDSYMPSAKEYPEETEIYEDYEVPLFDESQSTDGVKSLPPPKALSRSRASSRAPPSRGTSVAPSRASSRVPSGSTMNSRTRTQTQNGRGKKAKAMIVDDSENEGGDDDDDVVEVVRSSGRGGAGTTRSRASSVTSQTTQTRSTRAKSQSVQPLFLESQDDIAEVDEYDYGEAGDGDADSTLKSSAASSSAGARATRRTAGKAKSNRAVSGSGRKMPVDDDSDDGLAFKGFGAKRKGRR